jgi:cytochrome d ubiquinol oxidase subunit II
VLLAIVAISVWTPLANNDIARRWFSTPNIFWFSPVPVLVVVAFYSLLRSLRRSPHAGPFLLTLGLVFLGYSGLGISLWPNIIPPSVSIWQAAGPPQSLGFALVGALFVIPIILGYTGFAYYVFRGKVGHEDGYH